MKKYVFIIIIFFFCSACAAQSRFQQGIYKFKNEPYQVEYLRSDSLLIIYSLNGKYHKGIPRSANPRAMPILPSDIHVDNAKVREIVLSVLKSKQARLHGNNDMVHITMMIETNGKVSDIIYMLKRGTMITLEDVAIIDKKLKGRITATFTGRDYKDYKAVVQSFPVIRF